ncbi:MAG: HAD-IA family hydrolase [Saccharofermentans sp.]|nr:HAD-IA family hydrolase [Saccharofermentans sp.]
MTSKYDLVLYDLDGTLQDSIPLILESFREAYIRVTGECSRSDEDFMTYIGRPLKDTFAMHDDVTAKKLFDTYLEYNGQEMRRGRIPLFEGITDMLSSIKELGIPQGIVTSKRRESAMTTIVPLGLDKFMDVIICMEDAKRAKPYGDPIIEAASRLGIKDMSRVLYVGDAIHDIMSAKDCKADSAIVSWTRMPMEELMKAGPDIIITAPSDLPCIIATREL